MKKEMLMMPTIAEQIYPARFRQIESVIGAIQNRNPGQAMQLVIQYLAETERIEYGPEQLQMQLFLEALQSRLADPSAIHNLYLVPDQGQQIGMFNFMAEKFPVVRYAQDIANGIYLDEVRGEAAFVMLDIGIGTGQQAANLIERLAHSGTNHITILGIEPSADSLAKAQSRLQDLSGQTGISIDFIGILKTAEQLTEQDWEFIAHRTLGRKLILNASFALHHVQPLAYRETLLKRLKSLQPAAFVVIEPYADYTTEDLMIRFRNAWHHYGLTFLAIDTIEASETEKSTVKRVFFGREFPDVLGEGQRIEQYETGEMWVNKLVGAGFNPKLITHPVAQEFNELIEIEQHELYIGFNVKGHPIVAVISVS